MIELVALLTVMLVSAAVIVVLYRRHIRLSALALLEAGSEPAAVEDAPTLRRRRFARSWWPIPWIFAALVGGVLFAFGTPIVYCGAFGALVGLLGTQIEGMRVAWLEGRIESQLADAIDLMTGAVSAGAGLQRALEIAAEEAERPLRQVLEDAVGRIRFGDDPIDVMEGVRYQVPLETYRLFSTALAVNWQVGGSLQATLANVERTIRDRIELNRRVWAMSMQVRVSVAGVLLVTYLIAALVWRNDPQRLAAFLQTQIGAVMTASAMVLQGVGLLWMSKMAQLKF